MGEYPLLVRLARELPVDEFRLVAVLDGDTGETMGMGRAEVHVVPADGPAWQAAIAAADHVIGGADETTYHAAALGVPTVLGAWPLDGVAASSALAPLRSRLRMLAAVPGLGEQLAAEAPHGSWATVPGMATSPGECSKETPVHPLSLASPWSVSSARRVPLLARADGDARRVHVDRRPAEPLRSGDVVLDRPHLVVDAGERDPAWASAADVLIRRDPGVPHPTAWIRATLHHNPHVRMVAAQYLSECVVGTRSGRLYHLAADHLRSAASTDLSSGRSGASMPLKRWRIPARWRSAWGGVAS